MSARQLKRMEALHAQQPDSGSDSDALPDTLRQPNSQQRKKKKDKAPPTSAAKRAEEGDVPEPPTASPPEPTKADKPSTASGTKKKKTPSTGSKQQQAQAPEPTNPTPPQPRNARRRTKNDEDDEAFEAALRQYAGAQLGVPQPGSTPGSAPGTSATLAPAPAAAVAAAVEAESEEAAVPEGVPQPPPPLPTLATLLTADRRNLDPRTERIKAFGASSVENIAPKHPQLPKFRASALQSPDPNKWPPYDGLGLRIDSVHVQSRADGGKVTMYQVNTTSSEYNAATRDLKAAVNDPYAGVQGIMQVMHKYPYHVPTLLQLHKTFMTTGDGGIAQQCIDMALYTVGLVLVPILGKSGVDAMLLPSPGASMIVEVLKLGVYSAMRKGCAKTALELTKVMLSIDSSDPDFALLFADYIAIRASAFDWMIETYAAAEVSKSTALHCLASWRLNTALAAHLRAKRNAAAAAASSSKGSAAKQTPKPFAPTESKLPEECSSITADEGLPWLMKSICKFPTAAIAVADRAGMRLEDASWVAFINKVVPKLQAPGGAAHGKDSFAARHTESLFAERSGELWKMPLAMDFMKAAVAGVVKAFTDGTHRHFFVAPPPNAAAEQSEAALLLPYRGATLDDVMFTIAKGIPRELLEAGPTPEEQAAAEAAAMRAQMPPEMAESLDRLEAAFGPLPQDVPVEQRFAIYEDMLADRIRNLGDGQSAFALFLRTLLPWNTPREMALREAMGANGAVDPVVARRREQRRREQEVDAEFVEYHTSDDEDDER